MIKFLFLTIPSQHTYEQLKSPIHFKEDVYGVTTWTMKHPLTIYSADLKTKHVFNQNEVKLQPISNPSLQQKWRYFVITKKDGGKYYCTSQIIYQKGHLKQPYTLSQSQFFTSHLSTNNLNRQQYYLPRCIVLVSEVPYFKLQVNLLKIHKQLKKPQPAISHCIEEDLYEMYLEFLETGRQKQWEALNLNDLQSRRKTYCPLELSFSYYVDCCNRHVAGECIYIEKSTSREVLHLYKLNQSSLYQIGYFFHLPLSAFSLRKIISAILTEKQIVFSSSNANLTVMVIETLMQMILPLKWCYMYAPNLPIELIQAAQESFMPYIVGVGKQYLPLISKTNKIIIHIDTDEVQMGFEQQQDQLHMLSKKFERLLIWKSNSNKQYLEWQKQLRINSILLITTIFKKDLPIESGYRKFQSEQQKQSQQKFYEDFLSKSMMYRKLIEDVHEKVYSQFYKLTKMDFQERKNFLQNKFNSLHSQTIYPTKCDNKKEWIKFYEKYMRQKRKSRLNRHSLSMVQNNLNAVIGSGSLAQPFYASNVSSNLIINHGSRVDYNGQYQPGNHFMAFHRGSGQSIETNSVRGNFPNPNNNRSNQLYQSTVSSQSLNSYNSGLKFNIGLNKNSARDIYKPKKEGTDTSIHQQDEQKPMDFNKVHQNNRFSASSVNNLNTVSSLNNLPTRNFFFNVNVNNEQPMVSNQSNLRISSVNQIQNNFIKNGFIPSMSNVNEASYEYSSTNTVFSQQTMNPPNPSNQQYMLNKPIAQNPAFVNKNSHNSMIFNNSNMQQLKPHPLNQSMVASFIVQNQNIPTSPVIGNFTNSSSHRNLPSTQSTIVL